jgi:hypothetical protein
MKNSDSKNSLAELNPPEPICFVCLEESTPDTPLIESSLLRSCGCKFYTHADCWNKWRVGKTDADCPYCGRRTIHLSIPMTAPFQRDYTKDLVNLPVKNQCSVKKIIFIVVLSAFTIAILVAFLKR